MVCVFSAKLHMHRVFQKSGILILIVTLSKSKRFSDEQQNLSSLSLTKLIYPTRKDYNPPIFSRFVIGKNIWIWYISTNA